MLKEELKAKLEKTKEDAEAIKNTFPDTFTAFNIASAFKMTAMDVTAMLNAFKAFGFLKENDGNFSIVIHPDQRSINLNKNIKNIDDQIKVFKQAKKEAMDINSLTFAEKITL